jgi:EAL domain-containing protein (putative c-di-GMP-specific phosphodiesterase class I)
VKDFPIPWNEVKAIFIGGSTDWKLGQHARACVKAAKALGKWVHVGRVNTADRFKYFESIGADSCDGSGVARFSDMRAKLSNKVGFLAMSPCLAGLGAMQ